MPSFGAISELAISALPEGGRGSSSRTAGHSYWWLDALRRQQEADWDRLQSRRAAEVAARQAAARAAFEEAVAYQRFLQRRAVEIVLLAEL